MALVFVVLGVEPEPNTSKANKYSTTDLHLSSLRPRISKQCIMFQKSLSKYLHMK